MDQNRINPLGKRVNHMGEVSLFPARHFSRLLRRCGPAAISLGEIAGGVQRGFPLWLNRTLKKSILSYWL
jgi:hypothetical protein